MDGDSKKPLKIVITDFYKLHKAKGKEYTFKQFKKFGVHKATIYRWLKKIEQNGNCDRKSGSRTGKLMDLTVSTKKLVNNKTGVSQRKIANTLKISQSAVRKNI